jgi:hypothetical protein
MPTPAQVDSLLSLLETRAPIVLVETHEEARVMGLFEAISRRAKREVWTWSVSRGRATLDSPLRHMVGLPEASVRHRVRLTLGDGQITTADLTRVLTAKRDTLGSRAAGLRQHLPTLDDVAGMTLKRWLT